MKLKDKITRSTDTTGEVEITERDELKIGGEIVASAYRGTVTLESQRVELESYEDVERLLVGLNRLSMQVYGARVFAEKNVGERLDKIEEKIDRLAEE